MSDFSRLAQNTKDLLHITDLLNEKKVNLISVKEQLDTSTPTGRLMLTMIAAIYEFERQNLLERQAEGIAIAKKNGVYKGRKRIEVKDFKKYYPMCRKTPSFSYRDIRHVHRIYASN